MAATSWYDEARAYDFVFSFDPERELRFLDTVFRRAGLGPSARVLEAMCGSGRLLPGLAARGYRVFGFDLSSAMLALARPRCGPGIPLFRADAAHFDSAAASLDAVFCLVDSFRYLLSLVDADRFAATVAQALRPGGVFVLGLELASALPSAPESWSVTRDGRTATATIRSHGRAGPELEWMDAEVVLRHEETGTVLERVTSRLRQRRWTPEAFVRWLDALTAFGVESLHWRDHDPDRRLDALPRGGGPVIVVLRRESALGEATTGEGSLPPLHAR